MLYLLRIESSKDSNVFVWAYFVCSESKGLIKCIQSPYGLGETSEIKGDSHKILMYYINHANKQIKHNDIVADIDIGVQRENYIPEKRADIQNAFLSTSCLDKFSLKNHSIKGEVFKKGISKQSKITIFDFEIAIISQKTVCGYFEKDIPVGDIFRNNIYLLELYNKWDYFNNMCTSEKNSDIKSLIKYLSDTYPKEIKNLYQVDGTFLPFIVPRENHVVFPMRIDAKFHPAPIATHNSLRKQRIALNANLYNGNIYRLINKNPKDNSLTIGRCGYFDTLDSADYLKSRLKSYHYTYLLNTENDESRKNIKLMGEVWAKRMQQITQGDFSHFNSGFGFSLPIFRVLKNKGLELLCSKGSKQKAISNIQKQTFPSGSLEYWSLQDKYSLTIDDFKSIATKELFEENILGNALINKMIIDKLPELKSYISMLIDQDNPEKVGVDFHSINHAAKILMENWDRIWKAVDCKKPSLECLSALNSSNGEQAFLIVDALNFRPEIIFPLYIKGELNKVVNWELEELCLETVSWSNADELDDWVKGEYPFWSIPSLAATYLSAKRHFELIEHVH